MRYQHVSIHPWVGESYGKSDLFNGFKLLVLGESEYQRKDGQPWSWHDTIWVIKNEVLAGKSSAFFTNIASMLTGHLVRESEKRTQFWNAVAFYNFVQEHAGFGARTRPTPQMWREQETVAAFYEVLEKHSPNYIIVLGFHNWWYLPAAACRKGRYVSALPPTVFRRDDIRQTCCYKTDTGEAQAVAVKHPSAGFNFRC
jgi:hypothetical protein